MFKKLALTTGLAVCAAASTSAFAGGDCGGAGLGDNNLNDLHPFYYNGEIAGTTASGIPHLPAYYGHMKTNGTNRFFNVNEMVATMIGEGKHGLWRTQDNGTVREYLTAAAKAANVGLAAGEDPNTSASFDEPSEWANYSHSDAADSWAGYVADGNPVNGDGNLAYVDLPISHPKYDAKADGGYDSHVPIDLPSWYCTMSGPEYQNAQAAVRFAFGQPGANIVGPLGKRAGLDIKENYLNVLRMEHFPDANSWVNATGDVNSIDYDIIDEKKTPAEYYLVERPFFNEEYLFIIAVFDDKGEKKRNFSYVRPDGAYYDHLMARKAAGEKLPKFRTRLPQVHPKFAMLVPNTKGNRLVSKKGRASPTNLYGVHHPTTGACPAIGGDFGASYYGGSWPNTYQEITPLCDAVMTDIKFYANLYDGKGWDSKGKYLANATIGGNQNTGDTDGDNNALTRGHTDVPGVYGAYADPYLTGNGITNLEQFTATGTQSKTYQTSEDAVSAESSAPFVPSL